VTARVVTPRASTKHGKKMTGKTPRESEAILADLMMPNQANGLRTPSIFGGVVMSMVDKCAALSAMKHSGGQATTLSVERILFFNVGFWALTGILSMLLPRARPQPVAGAAQAA